MNSALTLPTVATAWRDIARCDSAGVTLVPAETSTGTSLGYAELLARAAAQVPALTNAGIEREEPVLITAHSSFPFLITYLALMLYGSIPVPLPPQRTLGSKGVFRARLSPLLKHHRHLICEVNEAGETATHLSGIRTVTFQALADTSNPGFGRHVRDQLAETGDLPWPTPGLDDDAYIQYTSGSTGRPRGVIVTHRNLLANMRVMRAGLGLAPGRDLMASWLPLHHDMGLVACMLTSVINQTSLVLTAPYGFLRDPLRFMRLLTSTQATHCFMPNFALEWILHAHGRPRADTTGIQLDRLRFLGVASEPISLATLHNFRTTFTGKGLRETALSPAYGLAEATGAVAINPPTRPFHTSAHHNNTMVASGEVMDDFDVKISAGNIRIRGSCVATHSYINGTKVAMLDTDGYYDTHDIGYLDHQELVILGRSDDVIIHNGENTFPYDIEYLVRMLPGPTPKRVACFGVQTAGKDATCRVILVYETISNTAAEHETAESVIHRKVMHHAGVLLSEIIPVPRGTIPVTTSGKIKRGAVRSAYLDGTLHRLRTSNLPISNCRPARLARPLPAS